MNWGPIWQVTHDCKQRVPGMMVEAGLAPGHLEDSPQAPVGVVDIGSNSVRLVVYDGRQRAPIPLFNERVLAGLGRGMGETGKLHPDGVTRALASLDRYARLAAIMGVEDISAVATAAVRDASDGQDFVKEVESRCGFRVRVLTGEEEAQYSALGVVSGAPDAAGIMGDMGGGSLELVKLGSGARSPDAAGTAEAITLPLGALRLLDRAGKDPSAMKRAIAAELDRAPWLAAGKLENFYAVGGTWRSLARIHMLESVYALQVIDHYSVRPNALLKTLRNVAAMSRDEIAAFDGVKQARIDTIPVAAAVFAAVIDRAMPGRVVFSAQGLREGLLYHRLNDEVRKQDPLIEACRAFVRTARRFGPLSAELLDWTAPLFPDEDAAARRLRLAACLLSDIGWREHPNHRADHVTYRVLNLPAVGLDHQSRLFLAETLATRYGRDLPSGPMAAAEELLPEGTIHRARVLGTALRLALTLCGSAPGVLPGIALDASGATLSLKPEAGSQGYINEIVLARLNQLASVLGKDAEVVTPTGSPG